MIELDERPRRYGDQLIHWTENAQAYDPRLHAVTYDATAEMVNAGTGIALTVCLLKIPVEMADVPEGCRPVCRGCLEAILRANLPDIADILDPPKRNIPRPRRRTHSGALGRLFHPQAGAVA